MGRIKGWKLDENGYYRPTNPKSTYPSSHATAVWYARASDHVLQNGARIPRWRTWYVWNYRPGYKYNMGTFPTEKEAKQDVLSYMRSHPNG